MRKLVLVTLAIVGGVIGWQVNRFFHLEVNQPSILIGGFVFLIGAYLISKSVDPVRTFFVLLLAVVAVGALLTDKWVLPRASERYNYKDKLSEDTSTELTLGLLGGDSISDWKIDKAQFTVTALDVHGTSKADLEIYGTAGANEDTIQFTAPVESNFTEDSNPPGQITTVAPHLPQRELAAYELTPWPKSPFHLDLHVSWPADIRSIGIGNRIYRLNWQQAGAGDIEGEGAYLGSSWPDRWPLFIGILRPSLNQRLEQIAPNPVEATFEEVTWNLQVSHNVQFEIEVVNDTSRFLVDLSNSFTFLVVGFFFGSMEWVKPTAQQTPG